MFELGRSEAYVHRGIEQIDPAGGRFIEPTQNLRSGPGLELHETPRPGIRNRVRSIQALLSNDTVDEIRCEVGTSNGRIDLAAKGPRVQQWIVVEDAEARRRGYG